MLLYLESANGGDINSANVDDAVWAANQTQIAQWIASRGFTYYTDTTNDPSAQTLTNATQVQTWILTQPSPVTAIAPGALTAAAAPPSSNTGVIVAVVGVTLVAALFLVARARA